MNDLSSGVVTTNSGKNWDMPSCCCSTVTIVARNCMTYSSGPESTLVGRKGLL